MLQPWRERLLTALLVVVIAVPVGIVIGGGLDFGGPDESVLETTADAGVATTSTMAPTASTTTPRPTASTTTAPAVASRPPSEVSVRFSNGSRTAGAAVTVGNRLKEMGYDVLTPGASPGDPVPATVIQYRDGFAAEAAAVATALGAATSPVAMPTPPTFPGIGDADVFVVVGEEIVEP